MQRTFSCLLSFDLHRRPGPWHRGQMVKQEMLGLWEGRATPAASPAALTPQEPSVQPQTLDGFLEREGEGCPHCAQP